MKINTDDLIEIYRSYIQEQVPQSRKKCPSLEAIINLFTTPGSTHKKGKIVDHLTSCRYCAQEFGFSLEIFRKEGMFLEEIDRFVPQRERLQADQKGKKIAHIFRWPAALNSRPYWKYAVMFLSTIMAVATVILVINQFIITPKNIERGRTPGQIHLLAPAQGKAHKAPLIFKWKLAGKFDYCTMEIFDEALSPVWKSPRIYKDSYQLPSEIEAKIQENRIYYWMTSISLVDGKVIESNLENFTLVR